MSRCITPAAMKIFEEAGVEQDQLKGVYTLQKAIEYVSSVCPPPPKRGKWDGASPWTLNDAQQDVFEQLCAQGEDGNYKSGVVLAPPGFGKTVVMINFLSKLNQNALIVAPSREILKQWKTRVESLFAPNETKVCVFENGNEWMGSGPFDLPACVMITYAALDRVQKNVNNPMQKKESIQIFCNPFVLVFDEVHHLPGWGQMASVRATLKYGVTATLMREDLKIKRIETLIGPTVFTPQKKQCNTTKSLFIRVPLPKEMEEIAYSSSGPIVQFISAINPAKMDALVYILNTGLGTEKTIVFVEVLFALHLITEFVRKSNPDIAKFVLGPICGNTPKLQREHILCNFENSSAGILFASSVLREGYDSRCSRVVVLTINCSRATFLQQNGRARIATTTFGSFTLQTVTDGQRFFGEEKSARRRRSVAEGVFEEAWTNPVCEKTLSWAIESVRAYKDKEKNAAAAPIAKKTRKDAFWRRKHRKPPHTP